MSVSRREVLRALAAGPALGVVGCASPVEAPPLDELPDDLGLAEPARVQIATVRARLSFLSVPVDAAVGFFSAHLHHEQPMPDSQATWSLLVRRFLLSTDFFPDEDETRPLRFVAYYDPYLTPCYNPLARRPE